PYEACKGYTSGDEDCAVDFYMNRETTGVTRRHWIRAGGVVATLIALAHPCSVVTAASAPCSGVLLGVDSSMGTVSGELILGMAWGETFVANDTLLLSATVWRIPSEAADPSPLKFWITEVDSSGRPHTHLVVYEGPTISVVSADTSSPTPI